MSNLSEEEIIERVNKFINIIVLYGKTYGMTCDDLKKYQQVFRGLLDLYQQEKQKNEKLIEGQVETIEKILLPELLKKYISKDKIRDKQIKREFELQQEYKDFEDDIEWRTYKELLGEE